MDKNFQLDELFQSKRSNPENYKHKVIKPHQWARVTQLMDEELDKPRYPINFY